MPTKKLETSHDKVPVIQEIQTLPTKSTTMQPAHKKEGERHKYQTKNSHKSGQYHRTMLVDSPELHLNDTPKNKNPMIILLP